MVAGRFLLITLAASTTLCTAEATAFEPSRMRSHAFARANPKLAASVGQSPAPMHVRARGGASAPLSKATMGWLILALATIFELGSGVLLKIGDGFRILVPSVLGSLLYACSFVAFNLSLRYMEIGVAYAVWSAVVIAFLAVVGTLYFGESASVLKTVGVLLTIAGTACLSFTDSAA